MLRYSVILWVADVSFIESRSHHKECILTAWLVFGGAQR